METYVTSLLTGGVIFFIYVVVDNFKYTREATKYRKLYFSSLETYKNLLRDYNKLVEIINYRGGMRFLREGSSPQFTKEEIRQLIKFCHPDKHNGDKKAEQLTVKLLKMR